MNFQYFQGIKFSPEKLNRVFAFPVYAFILCPISFFLFFSCKSCRNSIYFTIFLSWQEIVILKISICVHIHKNKRRMTLIGLGGQDLLAAGERDPRLTIRRKIARVCWMSWRYFENILSCKATDKVFLTLDYFRSTLIVSSLPFSHSYIAHYFNPTRLNL